MTEIQKKTIWEKAALLLLAVFFALAAFLISSFRPSENAKDAARFTKTLFAKERKTQSLIDSLAVEALQSSYAQLFSEHPYQKNKWYEEQGITLLIYQKDTLKYWTNQSAAFENVLPKIPENQKLVHLKNGWFEMRTKIIFSNNQPEKIVGLILLKNDYAYQNQYLENHFQSDFGINDNARIVFGSAAKTHEAFYTKEGDYLCAIHFFSDENALTSISLIGLGCAVLAILFLLFFLQKQVQEMTERFSSKSIPLLYVLLLFGFRFLSIHFRYPNSIYSLSLFNPEHYGDAASIWFSSLGDLLINVLLLFYGIYYLSKKNSMEQKFRNQKINFSTAFFLLFFLLCFAAFVNHIFVGLIQNSILSFDFNSLFSLDVYSYIALCIVALLFFSLFILADKIIHTLRTFAFSAISEMGVFAAAIIAFVGMYSLRNDFPVFFILWILTFVLIIRFLKKQNDRYPFSGVVLILLFFSFYSMFTFTHFCALREKENRKIFAEKIATERDPLAEHLFNEVEQKIQNDAALKKILSSKNSVERKTFEKVILQKYFGGYWNKYQINVAVFDSICAPLVNGINMNFDELSYFENAIKNQSTSTESPDFFYLNNSSQKINYLARVAINSSFHKKELIGTLYLSFNPNLATEEIRFPDLLLDKSAGTDQEWDNYSYAKYSNGKLISYHGKFPYSLTNDYLGVLQVGSFGFVNKDGFNHLLYRPDASSFVILSKKIVSTFDSITTFSYLFAFFSVLLLFFLVSQQIFLNGKPLSFNFKNRVQYLLVAIVVISIGLFGTATIFYFNKQFQDTNKQNINEKMVSALIDIQQDLGDNYELIKNNHDYMNYILKKNSTVFFTDINLYDTLGNLHATSIPKIFDEGLISQKICPLAFYEFTVNHKIAYTDEETIGKLNYLSAYILLKNNRGKLLGYLNMPYFEKEGNLQTEISTFISTLINIYVLLFVLSLFLTVFISDYITRPLKLIQDKLSRIRLGKTNEMIDWKENDEIGSLVKEYNRMIAELAENADLLVKSERETAWREMAKQVAHEIKNPLTPMKLSIQQLQRTFKDHRADMETHVQQLTESLIEQIETLSSIANSFAAFAKMPKALSEKVELKSILIHVADLFKQTSPAQIITQFLITENCFVMADKEQLVRVFNNLIKNAIQALPEEKDGKIELIISREKNNFLIAIKDNGTGISPEAITKIFEPNFTTKSAGMGLGLAMVKNMIDSFNGSISFETELEKGTTFFVRLPEAF
ncbi:MAG: HAMP domain-containing sensor histidine kinase [Bacteroidia bacterium]